MTIHIQIQDICFTLWTLKRIITQALFCYCIEHFHKSAYFNTWVYLGFYVHSTLHAFCSFVLVLQAYITTILVRVIKYKSSPRIQPRFSSKCKIYDISFRDANSTRFNFTKLKNIFLFFILPIWIVFNIKQGAMQKILIRWRHVRGQNQISLGIRTSETIKT